MIEYLLSIHLRSDTTFGSGEGLAGLVDVEIDHDEYGIPLLGGRALKGLLVEEWVNLHFALGNDVDWGQEARTLFGISGANGSDGTADMRVGTASLPEDLVMMLRKDISDNKITTAQVLAALTDIRRQTSQKPDGTPQPASLRSVRVLLRETPLLARLYFGTQPTERTLGLLAACTLAVRRGGSGRNRGRGRLSLLLHESNSADLTDDQFTRSCFRHFAQEVDA